MKLAILGPGRNAVRIAEAVKKIPDLEPYAVASRSIERAEAFRETWGYEKAYGSYEEMLSDEKVELVYIATPHSHHYSHAKLCMEHGKHVLLEKAFTVNAAQARALCSMSEEKGLLLAEAIWTRYMPARKMLDTLLNEGVIGKPHSMTANLGYEMTKKERLLEPSLAGGALLDVGVYPINFALMHFGNALKDVKTSAVLSDKGVDQINQVTLVYEDGKIADLHSTMLSPTDRRGVIFGTDGYIEVENINNCEKIRIYNSNHVCKRKISVPKQINGYEYELISCVSAIRNGLCECPEMPHEETVRVMELLDSIRSAWGMKYPAEIERV